jgi:hypothetical protein
MKNQEKIVSFFCNQSKVVISGEKIVIHGHYQSIVESPETGNLDDSPKVVNLDESTENLSPDELS